MVCSRLGRLDEAMNAFKALLAAHPGDAAAALQLASVQEALGDSQGALDCLEALQARFPDDSSLLRRLGVLHSRCVRHQNVALLHHGHYLLSNAWCMKRLVQLK